jgi:FAD/FMN-containing dehydrogenase
VVGLLQDPTRHERAVERLASSYRAIPQDAPVRLAKRTSNLFRARAATSAPGLDVSELDGVINVDLQARTADVQGMCTYEHLVDATLALGLAPLVVPQLKTITLGGAVTGLGIESTSFRSGLPHESVLEMDVLTGSGEIVTATPDGPNSELFHGFPNSYGTLGYATRLRIALEPVEPFVSLRHLRFHDLEQLMATMGQVVADGAHEGVRVDYLDGVVFSATEAYLTLGTQTSAPGPTSDYTGQQIYYRSIQHDSADPKIDRMTIRDYLWRWDTDWFWCSRAFGAQHPVLRRLWPARYRRSSFYWKLMALDHRFDIADRIEARHGRPPRERVVQDVEVPLARTAEFLHWFLREIPIEPLWLCPVRSRDHWPLYPLQPGQTYVNVGFWSSVPRQPADAVDATGSAPPHSPDTGVANRLIEDKVTGLDGHKSLYSDSYYDQEQFWRLYGGDAYAQLKRHYDPQSRLLDLYSKAVLRK